MIGYDPFEFYRSISLTGKALLLLNENGFKQRVQRSGDVLFKALQQHCAMIASLNRQGKSLRI
jgi:hypothetical protein